MRHLPLPDNDVSLVEAVRAGRPGAAQALFQRHRGLVRRVLVRVLGVDSDLPDLVQDVFVIALEDLDRLDDATSLPAWLTSIAVFRARDLIRKRSRRRLLSLLLPVRRVAPVPSPEVSESLRATYRVLERMPVNERIPFTLRVIDGMELTEVAAACQVSLATIKRHLLRSRRRFVELAAEEPSLSEWIASAPWGGAP